MYVCMHVCLYVCMYSCFMMHEYTHIVLTMRESAFKFIPLLAATRPASVEDSTAGALSDACFAGTSYAHLRYFYHSRYKWNLYGDRNRWPLRWIVCVHLFMIARCAHSLPVERLWLYNKQAYWSTKWNWGRHNNLNYWSWNKTKSWLTPSLAAVWIPVWLILQIDCSSHLTVHPVWLFH